MIYRILSHQTLYNLDKPTICLMMFPNYMGLYSGLYSDIGFIMVNTRWYLVQSHYVPKFSCDVQYIYIYIHTCIHNATNHVKFIPYIQTWAELDSNKIHFLNFIFWIYIVPYRESQWNYNPYAPWCWNIYQHLP